MALSFFKQRDIDAMDPGNIPVEFKNYFKTLDDTAKSALLENRPDLARELGFDLLSHPDANEEQADVGTESALMDSYIESTDDAEVLPDNTSLDADELENAVEDVDEDFIRISDNYYKDVAVIDALHDNMEYLEALTMPDQTEQCLIHRIPLIKKQIRYVDSKKRIFGLCISVCEKCNRAFIEESKVESARHHIDQRHLRHKIYDVELSTRYLMSQLETYEITDDDIVYMPETWVEENPKCPIHNSNLFPMPCKRIYKDREVSFSGHFCDKCKKILVRPAMKGDLLDQCHEVGVPEIIFAPLVLNKPRTKRVFTRKKSPDYYVENGKRHKFDLGNAESSYVLTEDDTVVVADSIYCSIDNHETEEAAALIEIEEKKYREQSYLFLLGYCSRCQKYYMDIDDYKVICSIGRPKVTVLFDVGEEDFQITSGAVFNIEKRHLDDMEGVISDEIDGILQSPDYASPYTVGDYDDGGRAFSKERSNRKYRARLDELQDYINVPYSYRVDISCDDKTEVYYIGATDVIVDGKIYVISANNDFGRDLINYQTTKVNKDGKEYKIRLTREFDITRGKLFGYNNLRTDEDLIFKSGITDPFLVRVLNMRKHQHNMTDIFVTIQENQNRIVDAAFTSNLIVQGCAGSGKTMVLLHRLSSLKYKQKNFDFNQDALILTPNEQFNLHIKGLAEGLQIGNIARVSIEEYYIEQLLDYDKSFKPDRQLASEQNVRQDYVDYIYSDAFKIEFDAAYNRIITERNSLAEILDNLADAMGQPRRTIDLSENARVTERLKFGTDAMGALVKEQDKIIQNLTDSIEKLENRKIFLEEKMPEAKVIADDTVRETIPRVYSKIGEYLSEKKAEVENSLQQLEELTEEQERVQKTIIMLRKGARLDELNKQIRAATRKKDKAQRSYEESYKVMMEPQTEKSDKEILEWMRQVMLYIPTVREDVNHCKSDKDAYVNYETEYRQLEEQILATQTTLEEENSKMYSREVRQAIQYLYDNIAKYEIPNVFRLIFDQAVSTYMVENKMKAPSGKYYRYTLYAELLFSMRYFGEVHGTTKFMCVDEGQDLALNEYRLLYDLNGRNMVINIFGDTNQLIKPGRGISDWDELKKFFHANQFVLNENYRNINQITRFCNDSFDMAVLQTGVDGAAVREIPRKDLEQEISFMVLNMERVAIIVPRQIQKRSYLKMDAILSERRHLIGDKMESGYITVAYVDEVKGIEFDRVFVVANGMTKNEKYIAYTRALSELVLVVDESITVSDNSKRAKNGRYNLEGRNDG